MVAPAHKRKKVGRCKFHDGGKCTYGDRCRFNHVGAAVVQLVMVTLPLLVMHHTILLAQLKHPILQYQQSPQIAVANLAAMVAKVLTCIASHAQCSVAAVTIAEVLLNKLQKRRKMSAVKRSLLRHDSGDISCALSANGCDIATDWVGPQGCGTMWSDVGPHGCG